MKNEMPCHQQGKQDGNEPPVSSVVTEEAVPVVSVVMPVELVEGTDSVTPK